MLTPPTEATADRWLTRPVPVDQPRLRLLCLPHAGSGAAQFRPWANLLPADVELCPVRLPGRETRLAEPPLTSLDEAVEALLAGCEPLFDRPFAIFGHSMGAMVGFELTRRLARRGGPLPVHLFVSGRRAPHLPDPEPAIHRLPDTAFIAELARRYGPNSTTLLADPELRSVFLPILRADFELVETYAYSGGSDVPLACPLTAFGGFDDPRATEPELAAWASYTSAAFALHRVPGDHFFHQATRQELVGMLRAALPAGGPPADNPR